MRLPCPALAFLLLTLPFAASSRAAPRSRQTPLPNIVLILADDLGYGDLGCYGQSKIKTPNLDKLAAQGMRFTQAYAGNTVCAPSRCCLMTGLHSGHGRVRSNFQVPLAPEDITIAEVLRVNGYKTAAFGKWALGLEGTTGHPNRQGFDEWCGFLDQSAAHDYYPAALSRNDKTFILEGNRDGQRREYAPDWFLRTSTNFVRINSDSPFFLYWATTIPHANNERGTNGMEVPSLGAYAKEPWPAPERAKAAMISYLDRQVGQLLAWIQQQRLEQETLVLFTSDNGPHKEGGVDPAFFHSSGPLRGFKRDLYEGGIRVPLIARWPGHIRPGTTNDLPVAFWDFLPTFAELAKVDPPSDLDGISFAPSLLGRKQERKHEFLYWEFHERGDQQAARMDDWKGLKLAPDKPLELYNLASDLGETNNVAAANPEIVAKIEAYLAKAADPFIPPKETAPKPSK